MVQEFGSKNAGELEMISTIIYVDRSAKERESSNSIDELADKVFKIKLTSIWMLSVKKPVVSMNANTF